LFLLLFSLFAHRGTIPNLFIADFIIRENYQLPIMIVFGMMKPRVYHSRKTPFLIDLAQKKEL